MSFNRFDRLIASFAPTYAMNRVRARNVMTRGYEGAKKGRRLSSWGTAVKSANADIKADRDALIARSRDLENNDPYAKGSFDAIVTNMVGDGIIPTPYIFNENENTPDKQRKILSTFDALLEDWADTSDCDFMDMTSLYGIQGLVARTIAQSGMCFVIKEWDPAARGIPLRLKVLEPDFLDVNKNQESTSSVIFKGIQINKKTSRLEGYWFLTEHPDGGISNTQSESVFHKISDVLAPFMLLRPGQLIGVPWLYSALTRLHDFNAFEDAQLVKQKISATTVSYITKPVGEDGDLEDGDGEENYYETREPGANIYLNPGESVTPANAPSVDGYVDFTRGALRAIARAIGLTYEELAQDYSNVNFSSAKMGWMSMNRNVKMWRSHMFNPMFLDKLGRWIISAAQLKMSQDLSFIRIKWTPPRREMIDPVKEISANAVALKTGQTTLQEIYAETGRDFKKAVIEMKEAKDLLEKAGIAIEGINLNINVVNDGQEENNADKSKS